MDFFVFGEIVKTRGLRGCVKALSFLQSQDVFGRLAFVDVETKAGRKARYPIKKINPSGKFIYLELEGVSDVDAAGALVGSKLLMARDLLEDLPQGEYYWRDIIGLDVYSTEGQHLGAVDSIFPTGSNDVFVCRQGKKEILIPAISDVVESVDLSDRKIIVKLLEGLL